MKAIILVLIVVIAFLYDVKVTKVEDQERYSKICIHGVYYIRDYNALSIYIDKDTLKVMRCK